MRVLVSGICGAQLQEIRGEKGTHFPRFLGHEGCGIVEGVGPGVTKLRKGQKVVMHWRKGSGMESESPRYYVSRADKGTDVITSGQVTTFSEFSVCSENRLTAVPDETPNELCALLGCGLSTALGVMENEAKLKAGESVLIVGCGGVGLNLIRVAKMMGGRVTALDNNHAKQKAALEMCDGTANGLYKFDVIVDTSGNALEISRTMGFLAPSGRYIMVGQPPTSEFDILGGKPGYEVASDVLLHNARKFFDGDGATIKFTQGGQFNPDRDIPRYVKMWQSNHLRIDGIITHRFPFSEINEAIATVQAGNAGRAIIEMV